MMTIQRKIILLSITILLIMGSFWAVIGYFNQKTNAQYNEILERYLLLHQTSARSEQSLLYLSNVLNNQGEKYNDDYKKERQQLTGMRKKLTSLKNADNQAVLMNYTNMISSQVEAMDLSLRAFKLGQLEEMTYQYNEATKISQYVANTTLTLMKKEITFQKQFYLSVIDVSRKLQSLGIWTLGGVFLILIGFSYMFSKGITRSINELTMAAKELSSGLFDRPIHITSNDEVFFLAKTFEHMRQNIRTLIEEIRQKAQVEKELQEYQLLLKESELKRLQHQINPHFLYNTLNTLAKKAYLEESYETSDLITTVANLLRYNLKKVNTPVTLREEMELINDYLTILKARFTNRITFFLQISPDCLDFKMPHFVLQPIVENAFNHGIEPYEKGGTIFIGVNRVEEGILIQVKDDGAGMSKEQEQLLQNYEFDRPQNESSTGIGLKNVVKRLSLFYGKHDIFSVSSRKNEGTTVSLLLPFERKDEII
ncbi:sensor histidine kinase [Priestia koreensis]|uniref:histidine kinase n=1 Tax=Priestia koreensis TaxID=284581 RepID=A0A0M0L640_9BACI|nr:sensor histidine kinase [Priestia koreensis]KOO46342.1 hypothetical protein AMD01_10875 [Priestia koreensis]